MKLIYVTASLPYAQAMEDFFLPELGELRRLGHQVRIVPRLPRGSIPEGQAQEMLNATLAAPLLSWKIAQTAFHQFRVQPRRTREILLTLCRSRDTATFLKNLAVLPKGLWLGRLAARWNADHIHAHWASTTATMAMVAAQVCSIPWSFTAHRSDIVQNNLLNEKVQQASFVRFISDRGVQMARDRGVTNLEKKSCVIHMGVSIPPCIPDPKSTNHPPAILCPANLNPVKGHTFLLHAMALLKQRGIPCHLNLAGDGPLREELEALTHRLLLFDRVTFLGQIPHETLLDMYRHGAVSAVVLPSLDLGQGLHEGIPVSLMEAMGYRIPVISTCTGSIPELLHGGAGTLVPPEDAAALADAVQQILHDSALRTRLAQAGRRRIEQEFFAQTTTAQLINRINSKRDT